MKPEKEEILLVLKNISPVLMEKYGVTKIGIFGSVARDQACESSDVDIVYEMIKPNGFTAVHLKEELEKKLNYPVDLVRYRESMSPLLKNGLIKRAFMYDNELVIALMIQVRESLLKIIKRSADIKKADDFINSEDGE